MGEHTLLGLGVDGRPDEHSHAPPAHEQTHPHAHGERLPHGLEMPFMAHMHPIGPGLLPPHGHHQFHPRHPDLPPHPEAGGPVINEHGEIEPSLCAGCGGKIIDRYYLLAVDKQWHVNCLKCADCNLPLDSELTCFAKDSNIYCKEDYYRRFAVKRCARCHMGISANELVMRAREHVFHMGCFTCASCHKTLATGDYFGMKDNLIYCRDHYEMMITGDYLSSPDGLSPPLPGGPIPFYNGMATGHKGRPRKRKSSGHDGEPLMQQLAADDLAPSWREDIGSCSPDQDYSAIYYGLGGNENELHLGDYHQHSQPPRQKRVRTSFKHHQLRTMKSYFALNHNPDAKDLKQLAQKTGLSKRVLQVWFQNARAKYRRNMLKQQGREEGQGGDGSVTPGPGGDLKTDANSNTLAEISNAGSPGLSDISSSPSLSDLQSQMADGDQNSSGSSLTELFTNSINTMQ